MPFACIFVPDFPVEALLRTEPQLRRQPLIVLEGKAPLQKVFAVNENARRSGVNPGMTKLQVETCAGLVLRAHSLLQETAAHAALLDCAQSFSPQVEDIAPDTVIIDLAGMETLFGPLPKIARRLAQRASELGLETSVAVAANPDTAMIAARGFSGITVIPEGKEAEQLGSLPVEVLFAEEHEESTQLLETFQSWGVRHLRELAALPDVALSERLGQRGVYLQKLARGNTSRTLVPVEPPLVFEEAIELEHPLVLLEPLAFLLSRMLEQLCMRLSTHALATQELRLEMELQNGWHEDGIPWSEVGAGILARPSRQHFHRTLRLPVPLLDPKTFLKLLQLDLKAHPPGAPIVKIHLAAEPVRPRAAQNGLFLPPSPEPEKLELTLARIAGIVGEDKVGSLQLLDTHRPAGFRMQRFTGAESIVIPSRSKPRSRGESVPEPALSDTAERSDEVESNGNLQFSSTSKLQIPRVARDDNSFNYQQPPNLVTALRIFRPPAAVTVAMQDGRPTHIASSKKKEIHGEILWAAGPWRSSGDWWEQEGWARDEWDIAVQEETGVAFYRLVRDLLLGRWLLEGTYD
ncbi:MAG TPA: DNA polymerase Y family protein [Terriglobales bacterium]|nr:DNA polymerase Y family protein [Terriglobales bacterium]